MKLLACAHFVFCEKCGLHGPIVFSDGSKTANLLYLEDASLEIENALKSKRVCKEEAEYLRKQLFDSNMPSKERVSQILSIIDAFFSPNAIKSASSECSESRTLH